MTSTTGPQPRHRVAPVDLGFVRTSQRGHPRQCSVSEGFGMHPGAEFECVLRCMIARGELRQTYVTGARTCENMPTTPLSQGVSWTFHLAFGPKHPGRFRCSGMWILTHMSCYILL